MKYKVLERFVSQRGAKVFEKGEVYTANTAGAYTNTLLKNGFIQPIREYDFDSWEKDGKRSKLAKVIIAPESYTEGDKKFFTWDEACAIKDKLGNGWRLPTRSEWVLICEEFGQKDGCLDADTLVNSLSLERHGWQDEEGSLRLAGYNGYYWATTAYPSELYAYNLDFNSTNVFPSYSSDRWYGFTVRLVKDVEE